MAAQPPSGGLRCRRRWRVAPVTPATTSNRWGGFRRARTQHGQAPEKKNKQTRGRRRRRSLGAPRAQLPTCRRPAVSRPLTSRSPRQAAERSRVQPGRRVQAARQRPFATRRQPPAAGRWSHLAADARPAAAAGAPDAHDGCVRPRASAAADHPAPTAARVSALATSRADAIHRRGGQAAAAWVGARGAGVKAHAPHRGRGRRPDIGCSHGTAAAARRQGAAGPPVERRVSAAARQHCLLNRAWRGAEGGKGQSGEPR
ncbi:hypothetical protein BU14_0324s0001 [Porphyra umbilicalis]|uniref:Uncharacterized protein n=1 Tax=Porphyra umbilicalis TaxID=2786 RepID=A0A1X6NZ09_PORUM|nr:hypothetical protein BU14_0324s0001 [Porphyra umbilicalis]|eukprot:OSX73838.1 hypothetical protein BU14_0324s0001 [Porphyra umbilicalis]